MSTRVSEDWELPMSIENGVERLGESFVGGQLEEIMDRIHHEIEGHLDGFLEHDLPTLLARWYGEEHPAPEYTEPYLQSIAAPLREFLFRGGKLWRPTFGILLLRSLQADTERYERLFAIVLELIHSATLIIDDIEDEAVTRRGRACTHRVFGLDIAINAANAGYFLPLLLIQDPAFAPRLRLQMYEQTVWLMTIGHIGQAADISLSRALPDMTLDAVISDKMGRDILGTYERKTAIAPESAARIASIIAEKRGQTRSACIDFARSFGVAFQLVDDAQDFATITAESDWAGSDLAQGKLTFVIHTALKKLAPAQREEVFKALKGPRSEVDDTDFEQAWRLVQGSGAPRDCLQLAAKLFYDGIETYTSQTHPSPEREALISLCHSLLACEAEHP